MLQIVIDIKDVAEHPKTTTEIKECCKDIKVLGRKDIKSLLSWFKQMKELKAAEVSTLYKITTYLLLHTVTY